MFHRHNWESSMKTLTDLVSIAEWHMQQSKKSQKPSKRQMHNAIANRVYGIHVQNVSQVEAFKHTLQQINEHVDLVEVLGFGTLKDECAEGLFDVMITGGVIVQRCRSVPGFMQTVDILDIKIPMSKVLGVKAL